MTPVSDERPRRPPPSFEEDVEMTIGRHSSVYFGLFAIIALPTVPQRDKKKGKQDGD